MCLRSCTDQRGYLHSGRRNRQPGGSRRSRQIWGGGKCTAGSCLGGTARRRDGDSLSGLWYMARHRRTETGVKEQDSRSGRKNICTWAARARCTHTGSRDTATQRTACPSAWACCGGSTRACTASGRGGNRWRTTTLTESVSRRSCTPYTRTRGGARY